MRQLSTIVIFIFCLENSATAQLKACGVNMELVLQRTASVGWIDSAEQYINHKLSADHAKCYYPVFDSVEALNNQKCCSCPPYSGQEKEKMRNKLTRLYETMWSCDEKFNTSMNVMMDSLRKVVIGWCMNKIKPIAQANGYDFVFDLCKAPALPLPPCKDVTDLVLKQLEW